MTSEDAFGAFLVLTFPLLVAMLSSFVSVPVSVFDSASQLTPDSMQRQRRMTLLDESSAEAMQSDSTEILMESSDINEYNLYKKH